MTLAWPVWFIHLLPATLSQRLNCRISSCITFSQMHSSSPVLSRKTHLLKGVLSHGGPLACYLPSSPSSLPLFLPRVPLQLVMPWMETGFAPLALPSWGLWLPLMKLALMDLDKSQGQVNFNGFLWENCLWFPTPPELQSAWPPHFPSQMGCIKFRWGLWERPWVPGKDF